MKKYVENIKKYVKNTKKCVWTVEKYRVPPSPFLITPYSGECPWDLEKILVTSHLGEYTLSEDSTNFELGSNDVTFGEVAVRFKRIRGPPYFSIRACTGGGGESQ